MKVYLTIVLLSTAYYAETSTLRHNTETVKQGEIRLAYDKGFHGFIDRSNVTGIQKLNITQGLETSEHITESHMGEGRKYFGSGVFISKYGGDYLYPNYSYTPNIRHTLKNHRNCLNNRHRQHLIGTGDIDDKSGNSDRFYINKRVNIVPGLHIIDEYRRYLASEKKVKDKLKAKGDKNARERDGLNNEGNIDTFIGNKSEGLTSKQYEQQSNISFKQGNIKDIPESADEKRKIKKEDNMTLTGIRGNLLSRKLQVGFDYIGHEVDLIPMALSSSTDHQVHDSDDYDDSDDYETKNNNVHQVKKTIIGNKPLVVPKWKNKRYQIIVNNKGAANQKSQAYIDGGHRNFNINDNKILTVKPTTINDYKNTYSKITDSYSYESPEISSNDQSNHSQKVDLFGNENKARLLQYWLKEYFENSNRNYRYDDNIDNKTKRTAKDNITGKKLCNVYINDVARGYLNKNNFTDKHFLESRFTVKNDQFGDGDQNIFNSEYLNSGNGDNLFKVNPVFNGYSPTATSYVNSEDLQNFIFEGDSNNSLQSLEGGKVIDYWKDDQGLNVFVLCSGCCGCNDDINNGALNNVDTKSSSYLTINSGSYVNGDVQPIAGQKSDSYTHTEDAFIPTSEHGVGKPIINLNFDNSAGSQQAQELSSTGRKGRYKNIIYNYGKNDEGLHTVANVDNSVYMVKSSTREQDNNYNVNRDSSENVLSKLIKKIIG